MRQRPLSKIHFLLMRCNPILTCFYLVSVSLVASASLLSSSSCSSSSTDVERTRTMVEMDNLVDNIMDTLRNIQADPPPSTEEDKNRAKVQEHVKKTERVTSNIMRIVDSAGSHIPAASAGNKVDGDNEENFGIPESTATPNKKRVFDEAEGTESLKSNRAEAKSSPMTKLSHIRPSESSTRSSSVDGYVPMVSFRSNSTIANLTPEEIIKRIQNLSSKASSSNSSTLTCNSSAAKHSASAFASSKTITGSYIPITNHSASSGLLFSNPTTNSGKPFPSIRAMGYASNYSQTNKPSDGYNPDTLKISSEIQETDKRPLSPFKNIFQSQSASTDLILSSKTVEEFIQVLSERTFMSKMQSVMQRAPGSLKRPVKCGQTLFEIALRRRCSEKNDAVILFNIGLLLGSGSFVIELSDKTPALSLAIESNDVELVTALLKIPAFKSSIDGVMMGAAMLNPVIYKKLSDAFNESILFSK